MNTPGDFGRFTDLMKKIVEKPKTAPPALPALRPHSAFA